ncbi:MAG: PAS domain S-box protein [Opitutaceae bacterium]|nr:PAS domain S-box protein [Opitutaceae bacterium]
MKPKDDPTPAVRQRRITALVRRLQDTERELLELTGGGLDAVATGDGRSYLLSEAQDQLRRAAALQRGILNALPAHIALLDPEGVIIEVNESWRRFASANVLLSPDFFVGQNYLSVCDRASGDCAEESAEAAEGIRRVLRGEVREFGLEYPCHSPTEKRWFRMMVTPVAEDRRLGAVVMHVNVTQRRLAEEHLREQEQEQRRLAEKLTIERQRLLESQVVGSVGSWETDLATLAVTWTDETFRIFETTREQFQPSHPGFLEFVHPDDRQRVDDAFVQSMGRPGSFAIEHRILLPGGKLKHIEERWQTFNDAEGKPVRAVGTCQDITARILAAEVMRNRARQQEAIAKIGYEATRATTLEGIFDFTTRTVAESLEVDLCKVLQLVPDGSHLRLVSGLGWQPGLVGVGTVGVDRESQAGFTLHSEGAIYVNDYAKETRFKAPPLLQQHDVVSGLSVKIMLRDKPWGVLGAHSRTVRQFNGPDADFMQAVATLLAVVIERLAVQQVLTESEARMREAQRIAHLGNWELDIAKNELSWSEEIFRIFGVEPSRFAATYDAFLALVHPDDRAAMQAAQEIALSGQKPLEIEHRIIRGDGEVRFVRERGELIHDENGKPVALSGTVLDVTDQRAKEDQLRLLETCVSRLNDIVLITEAEPIDDPGPRILYVNDAFVRRTGFTREEAIGKSPRILQGPKTQRDALDRLRAALKAWQPCREELINYTKSGEEFWVELDIVPVADAKGWFTHWVAIERDITERKKAEEVLRESQERFRLMVEGSETVLFYTHDREHRFEYLSPSTRDVLGYEPEDLVGKPCDFLVIADDPLNADVHALTDRALQDGKPCEPYPAVVRHKDGRRIVLEILESPILREGKAVGIQGFARDITERERAREALAESQRQYRDLVETSTNMIWTVDAEGRFTFVNQASRAIFGREPDEMIGHRYHEFVPEDQCRANDELMARMIRDGQDVINYSNRIRRKDGSIAILNSNARVVRDLKGQFIGISGMSQDTTEITRAQQAIAQSEARFRGLFDQAAVGMCLASTEGIFLRTNERFCEIVGYSAEEMLNRDCVQTTHPDDRAREAATVAQMLAGELHTAAWEKRYLHKDGHAVWCHLTLSLLPASEGQPRQFVGVIEDITARRAAEEKVRASEAQFRQLAESNLLGLLFWDRDGRITDANDAFLRMVGYSREDLQSGQIDWRRMTPLEHRVADEQALAEIASTGRCAPFEKEYFRKDGSRVAVVVGAALLDGAPDRGICFVADISQQKLALAALRVSEERFSLLAKATNDAVWDWDLVTNQLWWNDSYEVMFGYTRNETESDIESWTKRIHPDERESVLASIQAKIDSGDNTWSYEYRYLRKDGSYAYVLDRGYLIRNPEGKAVRMVGGMTDLTERRRAAEALAVSEREFRNLAEAMPQIVWITRPDGWNIYFNEHWMAYTGLTLEESLGHGWNKPFHPEDQQRAWDAWQQATSTVGTYELECRLRRADGEYRWWLIRGEPQKDADGNVLKWFGTCTDIHDLKHAELEIIRTNRALKMLSACNEALIHADDETKLLKDVCEIAVNSGGYRMAWVGFAQDDAQRTIRPVAYAGAETGYLSEVTLTWQENTPEGGGPGGRTIRTGQPCMSEDMEQDASFIWREAARRRGYRSVICLPLRGDNRTFGLLGLYSSEPLQAGAEEIKLLQELADDLAFGIGHLRAQQASARIQSVVTNVATAVSASTGTAFFEQLAGNMAAALGGAAGFVAEMLPGEPPSARIIAGVVDGKKIESFDYAIAGTPCVKLMAEDECVFPARVAALFPESSNLANLGAEAYVGRRLSNANGEKIGLLYVLFREPLKETRIITDTLRIFAARAASEMERRRAEANVREQAALLDIANEAIFVKDADDRIIYWNRGAQQIYGWTSAEALGQLSAKLLQPDPVKFREAHARLVADGKWEGELTKRTKEGRELTLLVRWTQVRDEASRPKSVLAINTDITERKKLEQQFLRAQRLESIGTLAGGIAHDLNNLLAPILMGVSLLRVYEPNPKSQQMISIIERSAERGTSLVKQVLSFARGVEGLRVSLEIKHVVKEVEAIAASTFPKNIRFETDLPQDLWPVLGDPTQLNQVLVNLCVNARDALPDGGEIKVSAANMEIDAQYAAMNRGVSPGRYVLVKVTDNGTGIPKEIIDRIFEPFFTTKEQGRGTGLGLSTVVGIVRSHGGFVNVYSEPGRGTTFQVYLPTVREEDAAGKTADLASPKEELPRGNGELILVVDDEEIILSVTRQTLETFGYKVVTAVDGAQAIGVYATRRAEVAVVITDMMMPIMDGPALIAALRRINPAVKIIGASGLTANFNLSRLNSSGVSHFLPKPYSASVMLTTLKEVLAGP